MSRVSRGTTAVAIASLALFLGGCNPLDSAELKREVDAVGSVAAEGQLLASDVAHDRTKATFARVHAGELASSAEESAQKINDADVATGLQYKADRAIKIAGDVSDALGEIQTAPGDEQGGAETEQKLKRLGDEAEQLAAEL
jgi:hypothetical protein